MRLGDWITQEASKRSDLRVLYGLTVVIEYPKGSLRELKSDDGQVVYRKTMLADYGYIKGTTGRDRDGIDCFIGPLGERAQQVYIVHMRDLGPIKDEREDEDKVMFGYANADDALSCFLLHYPRSFYQSMTAMPVAEFKRKLAISQLPYRPYMLHARKKQVQCPKCGGERVRVLPPDFESWRCHDCGKVFTTGEESWKGERGTPRQATVPAAR